jgi:hypothetical protein
MIYEHRLIRSTNAIKTVADNANHCWIDGLKVTEASSKLEMQRNIHLKPAKL